MATLNADFYFLPLSLCPCMPVAHLVHSVSLFLDHLAVIIIQIAKTTVATVGDSERQINRFLPLFVPATWLSARAWPLSRVRVNSSLHISFIIISRAAFDPPRFPWSRPTQPDSLCVCVCDQWPGCALGFSTAPRSQVNWAAQVNLHSTFLATSSPFIPLHTFYCTLHFSLLFDSLVA